MDMVGSTGLTKDGGYGHGFFYLMMHSDTPTSDSVVAF